MTDEPTIEPITIPNLDGVIKADDVATKGGGKFAADYVTWSKVAHCLHEHAPGWLPAFLPGEGDVMWHLAPDSSVFLLIYFRHVPTDVVTTPIPHAVMDHRMNPVKVDGVTARDLSDAFVRGLCKAAAATFGLGWQLWSKDDPFEREEPKKRKAKGQQPQPEEDDGDIDYSLVPYVSQDKDHALNDIWAATDLFELAKIGQRIKATTFVRQDGDKDGPDTDAGIKDELREAVKERRFELKDEPADKQEASK